MRSALFISMAVFTVMAAGCEGEKDSFSGFSDLVAERNEVRRTISKKVALKKNRAAQSQANNPTDSAEPQRVSDPPISANILYDKEIRIVDSQSGILLAEGRAYMNKQGRIVKIKILSE